MKLISALLLTFLTNIACANIPSPAGDWLSFPDNSKVPDAKIHVTLDANNILSAVIVETYAKTGDIETKFCHGCPGNLKDKPLKNLYVLKDLKPQAHEWVGQGFSPERKTDFSATVWLSADKKTLFVKGKSGLFSKTHQWQRLTAE